jgi:lipoprotein-anchoring transpeptidase ErfK/SrfK
MTVRAGLFLRTALAGAIAAAAFVLPGVFASAQQIDMNVVDQPGYQPSPQEQQLNGAYERQEVFFRASEAPGTVVIDTSQRFLYLVQPGNRALRYGIGVGRDGFQWSGLQKISRKQEWPDWRPPPEMIERQPYLPRFMAGGPGNPMGARALYLGQTIYRIHGTNQPQTIGHAVSSGCFRLVNDFSANDICEYGFVGVAGAGAGTWAGAAAACRATTPRASTPSICVKVS